MLSFSSLNIISILPMIATIAGAILILVIDLFSNKFCKNIYIAMSITIIAISLVFLLCADSVSIGFFNLVHIDWFSVVSQILILVSSLLFMLLIITKERFVEFECAEYFVLFLFMIAGYQFMVSSTNLVVIFLALESSSLALYALIAFQRNSKSTEAAIKYFTLGALGSGFIAFGLVFIYASSGSVDLFVLKDSLNNTLILKHFTMISGNNYADLFLSIGFIFLFAGIGFKLSLFPFHTWVPDIYEGSSFPLAFYMSIATKITAFVVAIRVFDVFLGLPLPFVKFIIMLVIILTITIPNIIALVQSDVARMLAYSSISQAGFALACVYIGAINGSQFGILFFYWTLFLFTNLGAFGLLWLTHSKNKVWDNRYLSPYTKFSGLVKTSPLLAIAFGIFMLSLAGVPPFGMFWGKLLIINTAIFTHNILLAVVLLLNSAIAVYYYLKLVIFMFLKEAECKDSTVYMANATYPIILVVCIGLAVSVLAIFFLGFLIDHNGIVL